MENHDAEPILVPRPLETIRQAYHELGRRVDVALHTQIGDHARLDEQRRAAMSLMASVEQVSFYVPSHEIYVNFFFLRLAFHCCSHS